MKPAPDYNSQQFQLRHAVFIEKDPLFSCFNDPEEISISTQWNAFCRSINKFQLHSFSTWDQFAQGLILGGNLPRADFLGGRFAKDQFGKGAICPAPGGITPG